MGKAVGSGNASFPIWNPAWRRRGSRGAQLLEFAFALPILLLLVMGAWDFGSAFLLQDKMTNAAREAARVSASTGSNNPAVGATCDGANATPCVIVAAVNALKLYMTNAGIDLSCIDPNSPSQTVGEQYTYTCAGGIQVVINRDFIVITSGLPVVSTQVSFSYPVTWWLARLFPAGVFPSTLTTVATMGDLIS